MKTFKFDELVNTYDRFQHPRAVIDVNGKSLTDERKGFPVSDIIVDLTSGFEASTAEFSIYDVFDKDTGSFRYEKVKKYILLGSAVEVYLGYGDSVRNVFVGAITRVNFLFEEESVPCIRVTAMDVKGVMMSGSYARQLKALYYSDAVREILEKTAYEKLRMNRVIRDLVITDTADKLRGAMSGGGLGGLGGIAGAAGLGGVTSAISQVENAKGKVDGAISGLPGPLSDVAGSLTDSLTGMADSATGGALSSAAGAAGGLTDAAGALQSGGGALSGEAGAAVNAAQNAASDVGEAAGEAAGFLSDRSLEMVAESDYEFVVKAAKKNNYEFYTECGTVYFRKAKSDTKVLISLGPQRGIKSLDISYDITGLVEKVIARGTDAGKAAVITAKQKRSGKLSKGNKAKALLKGSQKVFLDPSITSQEEADERARFLTEEMSYRLGSLSCDTVGLPELHPGHFIKLKGLGTAADNVFYIDRVRHVLDAGGTFVSELSGKARSVEPETGTII